MSLHGVVDWQSEQVQHLQRFDPSSTAHVHMTNESRTIITVLGCVRNQIDGTPTLRYVSSLLARFPDLSGGAVALGAVMTRMTVIIDPDWTGTTPRARYVDATMTRVGAAQADALVQQFRRDCHGEIMTVEQMEAANLIGFRELFGQPIPDPDNPDTQPTMRVIGAEMTLRDEANGGVSEPGPHAMLRATFATETLEHPLLLPEITLDLYGPIDRSRRFSLAEAQERPLGEVYAPLVPLFDYSIAIAAFTSKEAGGEKVREYVTSIAIANLQGTDRAAVKLLEVAFRADAVDGRAHYVGYEVTPSEFLRSRSRWQDFISGKPKPLAKLRADKQLRSGRPGVSPTIVSLDAAYPNDPAFMDMETVRVENTVFYLQDAENGGVHDPGPRAILDCSLPLTGPPTVKIDLSTQADGAAKGMNTP